MIATALNSKDAWEEHKKAYGFAEAQRPPWVGVGKEAAIALEAAQVLKEAKGVWKASQVGQVGADAPGSRVGTPIQGARAYPWCLLTYPWCLLTYPRYPPKC